MLTYEISIQNLSSENEPTVLVIPADENIVFAYDYIGDGEKKHMFKFIEYVNDMMEDTPLTKIMEVFDNLFDNQYSFSVILKNSELNTTNNIVNIEKVQTIDLRGEMNSSGSKAMLDKYVFMRVLEVV